MAHPTPIHFDYRVLEEIRQLTLSRGFTYLRQGLVSDSSSNLTAWACWRRCRDRHPPRMMDIAVTKGWKGSVPVEWTIIANM